MPDYRRLYTLLFNAITDALEDMARMNFGAAAERLKAAQQAAEDAYIDGE